MTLLDDGATVVPVDDKKPKECPGAIYADGTRIAGKHAWEWVWTETAEFTLKQWTDLRRCTTCGVVK